MMRIERQIRERRRPHCEERIEKAWNAAWPGAAGYRTAKTDGAKRG
jgi:hypothetical protein